jgi:hypothetical protein
MKVIPNNLLRRDSGASQSTSQQENTLPSSYKSLTSKAKDTWEARSAIARLKNLLSRSCMWSYKKAKYVSGTQFNNR